MSRRVEALLRAARQVEVGEPPSLAAIRVETGVRARRSAYLAMVAVAIPLGAAAAVGGWVVKEHHEKAPVVAPLPKASLLRGAGVKVGSAGDEAVAPEVEAPVAAPKAAAPVPTTPAPVRHATTGGAPSRHPSARHDGAAHPAALGAPGERSPAVADSAPSRHPSPRVDGAAHPAALGTLGEPSPGLVASTTSAGGTIDGATVAIERPAPARTTLSDEAALLTSVLTALRTQRNPAAALGFVAQYRAQFPAGVLRAEVMFAAAEAQRAAGHTAAALLELDSLTADPRRAELTVLRAELRAELGRCAEARAELAPALSRLPATLRARALFTDASCAATLGARDEAVAQLRVLLALDGSDARARALLEQLQ